MKKICFRVDANSEIGQGHAMRCLSVAKQLVKRDEAECKFAVSDKKSESFFDGTGFECFNLGKDYKDYSENAANEFKQLLIEDHFDIAFLDSYYINKKYISIIGLCVKTACFFCKEEKISVNLLINYNVNYNKKFYFECYKKQNCKLLLGTEYVPLREEFFISKQRKEPLKAEKILFLTGGSDSQELVNDFIENSARLSSCDLTVVVGKYSDYKKSEITKVPNNVKIVAQTNQIVDLMLANDLVISAGGTTMYELCALGIPSIIYSMADNQKSEAEYMGQHGYVVYVGESQESDFWDILVNETIRVVNSQYLRQVMVEKMQKLVEGNGSIKIAECLMRL